MVAITASGGIGFVHVLTRHLGPGAVALAHAFGADTGGDGPATERSALDGAGGERRRRETSGRLDAEVGYGVAGS